MIRAGLNCPEKCPFPLPPLSLSLFVSIYLPIYRFCFCCARASNGVNRENKYFATDLASQSKLLTIFAIDSRCERSAPIRLIIFPPLPPSPSPLPRNIDSSVIFRVAFYDVIERAGERIKEEEREREETCCLSRVYPAILHLTRLIPSMSYPCRAFVFSTFLSLSLFHFLAEIISLIFSTKRSCYCPQFGRR